MNPPPDEDNDGIANNYDPVNGNAPNLPSNPNPSYNATDISLSPTLTWSCSDSDGDPLTYDVYFGTTSNPSTQIASNLTAASLIKSGLSNSIKYYWKVIAKDNHGNSTSGSVWSFTVAGATGSSPIAAFTVNNTTITAGQNLQFTDQSTNSPTSWSWNFGDGSTSIQQSPSHTYTTSGTYTVSLTSTNSYGSNTKTNTNYITVNTSGSSPVAAYTANNTTITPGQSVQFTDQSTNSPTSWSWNFGDGSTSTQQSPSHIYTTAGTYTVSLTATNNYGSNTKSIIDYIIVTENGSNPINGLVAYYPFNGNALDNSGNGKNGTVNNVISIPDKNGNTNSAYSFDGNTAHFISIPNLSLGDNTKDKSFSAWFKLSSKNTTNWLSIIGQWVDDSHRWHLTVMPNSITLYEQNSNDNKPYGISVSIDTTSWHFVAAVCSNSFAANQKIKIYLDGAYLGSIGSYNLVTYSSVYNVGRYGDSKYWPVYGSVDNLRVYNRILSEQEIITIFNDH